MSDKTTTEGKDSPKQPNEARSAEAKKVTPEGEVIRTFEGGYEVS